MNFQFSIPTDQGNGDFESAPGQSLIFVGATGGGKTRLAVYIEQALQLRAHRISAHGALALNPDVAKISERKALMGLRIGNESEDAQARHREGHRWNSRGAVQLLNDFDYLIQALFADQSNTSLKALPVSEIENMILLPEVSRAIAEAEGYCGAELETVLAQLSDAIFEAVNSPEKIEEVVLRYCRRRIDRSLKKIDLSERETIEDLTEEYRVQTQALDISAIAAHERNQINQAINEQNLPKLFAHYDNKDLMALAASNLKKCKLKSFKSWLTRVLRNDSAPSVLKAIISRLPKIHPE